MEQRLDSKKEVFATKTDVELLRIATSKDMEKLRLGIMKSVYGVGLVQLVAIISSLLVIVTFLTK